MMACHRSSGRMTSGRWLSNAARTVEMKPSSARKAVLLVAEERMTGSHVMIESTGSLIKLMFLAFSSFKMTEYSLVGVKGLILVISTLFKINGDDSIERGEDSLSEEVVDCCCFCLFLNFRCFLLPCLKTI